MALVGWASAALQVGVRDAYLGWTADQKTARLGYVAQNARFLILPGYHVPNLGSRVLAGTLRRLAADWTTVHGHPVVLAETFVDPAHFLGTVYQAAGWERLGPTPGFGKQGAHYTAHGHPQVVWVRPLIRDAAAVLAAPFDGPALGVPTVVGLDPQGAAVGGARRVVGPLGGGAGPARPARRAASPDPHTDRLCAGGLDGGAELPRQRLALFCSPTTGGYVVPSEPTIRRTLTAIDAAARDRAVGAFLQPRGAALPVARDGKTVRGSGAAAQPPRPRLAVVSHTLGGVLAQRDVDAQTNEIPEALPRLAGLAPTGRVVTADALHTPTASAGSQCMRDKAKGRWLVRREGRFRASRWSRAGWGPARPLPRSGFRMNWRSGRGPSPCTWREIPTRSRAITLLRSNESALHAQG